MRFSLIIGALGAFLFAGPIPKPKSFLPAPRNLKVDILRDRFTLTWDSVRNAAAYRVYLNGSASPAESTTESRASGILNEPGVYEFAVSSTDSVGNEGA